MNLQYVRPELKLAGKASEVIRGLAGIGGDYLGQLYTPEMDFESDSAE